MPNMLLEISGETTPERMKRWSQKQKQIPVVDVIGDRSKVGCCKEQYCIGTWNVRSMNQGKLEVVKQEMARLNVDILGISEQKWTAAKPLQSVLTLCDPIDGSPPGSPVPGILQARTVPVSGLPFPSPVRESEK